MSTVKANNIEPASGGTVTITGAALTTPALGTPASGTLTNCTGLPNAGLLNSSVTVNGTAISLGASGTVTAAAGTLTGATLASGVTAASLNAITPSGGTLAVTGSQTVSSSSTATQFQATNGAPAFSTSDQVTGGARGQFQNTGGTFYFGIDNSAGGLSGAYQINYYYTGAYDQVWSTNGTVRWRMGGSDGHYLPGADNAYNVGSGAYRVGTYYGATGSINTSDARLKTPLRALSPAELAAGLEIAKLGPGVFQFLDAVAEKGADRARLHVGYTVQAVMAIMASHGLDPARYAFICHDTWGAEVRHHPAVQASAAVPEQPAVYEERMIDVVIRVNGEDRAAQRPVLVEVQPAVPAQPAVEAREAWTETVREAGDRYSFRPDQLDRFINAAVIQAAIERLGL